MSRSASSRACRPVALPALLLLLLLFLSSPSSSLAACTVLCDDASSGGRHRPARRLLVSQPLTHMTKQWMWVGGDKRPFKNDDAGASLGRRRIPPRTWNPVHN